MTDTVVLGIRTMQSNVARFLLVALVALAVAFGSLGINVNRAEASWTEEVAEAVCNRLSADIDYWSVQWHAAQKSGDKEGVATANQHMYTLNVAYQLAGCF